MVHLLLKGEELDNISRITDPLIQDSCSKMKYILDIFNKLGKHKFSLPLLETEWDICKEFIRPSIKERTHYIIEHQELHKEKGTGVHLIFEGVGASNEYFAGLQINISSILK
jgi:hypothetical protein